MLSSISPLLIRKARYVTRQRLSIIPSDLGRRRKWGGQWMQGKRVATQNIFKLRLLTININYSIIQKILQAELMNLQVLELSLAILGVELHILVWSYREDEIGHGDTAAIYEELYR